MIATRTPEFRIELSATPEALKAAQALRYAVFVDELGATGPSVDHVNKMEKDPFDPHVDHLLLHDDAAGRVAGVYRMIRPEQAAHLGHYYSESEYDVSPLRTSGRRLLELGRSCLHADYRGGTAMYHLWNALARYIADHKIDVLFGVASFHGTDPQPLAQPLSLLHHRHLAAPHIRPVALAEHALKMDMLGPTEIDRKAAMVAIPSLIKAYLRLGGTVGQGAYIDHAFNTIDVCLVMDTAKLNTRQARIYRGAA